LYSLIDVNDGIFAPLPSTEESEVECAQSSGVALEQNYPRYYSEGYDATHDSVDEKEISQWRNNFNCLRIVGTGVSTDRTTIHEVTVDEGLLLTTAAQTCAEDDWFVDNIGIESSGHVRALDSQDSLVVMGKAVTIHSHHTTGSHETCMDEDYFCYSEGVLEDYLICNAEDQFSHDFIPPPISNAKNKKTSLSLPPMSYECVSPSTSIKEELVASLIDMLWPDVVDALKPIVKAVLNVAQDNNCIIPRAGAQTDECNCSGTEWNQGDSDDFLFADGSDVNISW